jgi:hypothetical protein
MAHWTCGTCGVRLYSASETLRWGDCPVCAGKLEPDPEPDRDNGAQLEPSK